MKNINKFIIFLITITVVLIIHNNKDNFTIVKNINILPGPQGNFGPKGPIGNKGPAGSQNVYNDELLRNQLNNQLKLGSSKNMFNNDYQIKLSGRIKPNGTKLKIDKFSEDDNKSNYIKCETDNKTNFYINNKKVFLDGNATITGDVKVRYNNDVKSLKYDRIPSGLIFPYYFDNMSNIGSGFYFLKFGQKPFDIKNRLELHKIDNIFYKISLCDTDYVRRFFKYEPNSQPPSITTVTNSNDNNCFFRLEKTTNKKYSLVTKEDNKYLNYGSDFELSNTSKDFELLRTIPFGWKLHSDSNDKFIVGANSNITRFLMNTPGGADAVTIVANNLPAHKHKTNVELEYSINTDGNATNYSRDHIHEFKVIDQPMYDPNGTENAFVLAHPNEGNITSWDDPAQYDTKLFENKYGGRDPLQETRTQTFYTKRSGNHNHSFNNEFLTPYFRLDDIDRENSRTVPFAIAPETMKILYIEKE